MSAEHHDNTVTPGRSCSQAELDNRYAASELAQLSAFELFMSSKGVNQTGTFKITTSNQSADIDIKIGNSDQHFSVMGGTPGSAILSVDTPVGTILRQKNQSHEDEIKHVGADGTPIATLKPVYYGGEENFETDITVLDGKNRRVANAVGIPSIYTDSEQTAFEMRDPQSDAKLGTVTIGSQFNSVDGSIDGTIKIESNSP